MANRQPKQHETDIEFSTLVIAWVDLLSTSACCTRLDVVASVERLEKHEQKIRYEIADGICTEGYPSDMLQLSALQG